MNRRDVLKRTGALALGLPAISASRMIDTASAAPPGVKDLIVTVNGPFCYWLLENQVKVMAPPVGTDSKMAAHQAWMGTSANEIMLHSTSRGMPRDYTLEFKRPAAAAAKMPIISGTPAFAYEQGSPLGASPLFNFYLPFPERVIGVRPTDATILECPGSMQPNGLLAAGLTFYYPSVDLDQLRVTIGDKPFFQPCFTNDQDLPCASLGIHLTQLNQHRDEHHRHAKFTWNQMLTMYPWMQDEIKGIVFNDFDPAKCPPEPGKKSAKKGPNLPQYGPGNDCEVPIMVLSPIEPGRSRRKKC